MNCTAASVGAADLVGYELLLDTGALPVGPYDRTVSLRTSDPDRPTASLHLVGTIAAPTGDTAGQSDLRPLDVPVTVPGPKNQGEWVTFTHDLGPDPASLHPVKVYSQDYGTLHGVGKYATDFGQGTASYDMFGDGRDGVMPSRGNLDNNNGVGIGIVNSGNAGSTQITVTDAHAVGRIDPGDVVLIHQTRGSGAGQWEINKAVSDFTGSGTFSLEKPLKYSYVSNNGNEKAQILRVPQYSTCDITGTVTPLTSWNGDWGGILAVMCSGTMSISGNIDASGFGFRGGNGYYTPYSRWEGQCDTISGEGTAGPPTQVLCNANGNGGGAGYNHWLGKYDASGGGGGGNGSPGGDGGHKGGGSQNPNVGIGGNATGTSDLTAAVFGGGGGGGGARVGQAGNGGDGGNGGGLIFIYARQLLGGYIQAKGMDGNTIESGGGGGAGGSVLIRAAKVTLSQGIDAKGGSGGDTAENGGAGGNGGVGRIRIEYCESFTGSTDPPASTQKLDCYIAEQVESAPYNQGRLNLPESIPDGQSRTYRV